MSQLELMSFEAFCALLADLLDVDVERLKPGTYFITDLGVDSLRLAEILLQLEEMGVELSHASVWQIQTVGDAYRYYQEHISQ